MSKACCPVFLFVLITFLLLEVYAQSTVDDIASCESSSFELAVNLIREELKDMKNVLGSNHQCSATETCHTSLLSSEYRLSVVKMQF